jgi:hypothetical protein
MTSCQWQLPPGAQHLIWHKAQPQWAHAASSIAFTAEHLEFHGITQGFIFQVTLLKGF